jgi:cytidyltransferase-like protein
MKTIAIYPGRFHPFHKGHADSFRQLADKFGTKNTYLAISAKQEQPKSPFSAADRAKMAMALGIPKENIISVNNPYAATEYIERFEKAGIDPENTVLVFGVSKKDMEGVPEMNIPPDPRFSFKPKKDGSASYLQPYTDKNLAPMTSHAYIVSTDVAEFPIAGEAMRDASAIRKAYMAGDDSMKIRILQDLYGEKAAKILKPVFDANLQLNESITHYIKKLMPLIKEASPKQKNQLVKLLSEAKKKLVKNQIVIKENLDYLEEK